MKNKKISFQRDHYLTKEIGKFEFAAKGNDMLSSLIETCSIMEKSLNNFKI
jgi:hypothetical protein